MRFSGTQAATKRLVDFVGAFVGLVLFLPILLLVAIAVKLDSPGPIFFRHHRIGRLRRPFYMLKFRTMISDAVRLGPEVTSSNDWRVTRSGRILRKTKIDELPQLWNVLVGHMSLVGPRPQSYSYVPFYPEADLDVILSVRPGVTGPTQLWLRHEEEILGRQSDPVGFYTSDLLPRKIASDVAYVQLRSLAWDARIVIETVLAVLKLRPGHHGIAATPIHISSLPAPVAEPQPAPVLVAGPAELSEGAAVNREAEAA